jgi:hypothetical protein
MKTLLRRLPAAKQGKAGRPTKFTAPALRRVLRLARRGLPLTLIAKAVGVSTQGLLNYRKEHDRFESSLQRSIALGASAHLKKIVEAAEAGNWHASAWWLEHCQPELFAKSRLEVEAVGQLQHFVIPSETLNEIAEARIRMDRNGDEQRQLVETNPAS